MKDSEYLQARKYATGVTGDSRLLFGMEPEEYSLLGVPVSINNSIAVNNIGCGTLSRYRLWRRNGVEVRRTSEGRTLTLTNTELLSFRLRVAGKLTDANAFAEMV